MAYRVALACTFIMLSPGPLDGQIRGQSIDVGGHMMHFVLAEVASDVSGHAVVLLAGGGLDSSYWSETQRSLASQLSSTVVAVDRQGFGQSELPSDEYDVREDVADIRRGLVTLGVSPPYVIVAHSFGGIEAQMFAHLWPDDVSGILFLDPNTAGARIAPNNEFPIEPPNPDPQTPAERAFARMDRAGEGFYEAAYESPLPIDLPIVVVSAEQPPSFFPETRHGEAIRLTHQLLAKSVRDGEWLVAPDTDHLSIVSSELVAQKLRQLHAKASRSAS